MNWSLNEMETLARKAARGAGMSWGMAEEAGKATRWLCARGLPGGAILLALLEQNDQCPPDEIGPIDCGAVWRGPKGQLCPLIAGAALADSAESLTPLTLEGVTQPAFLLPFAAMIAEVRGDGVTLSWEGCTASFPPAQASGTLDPTGPVTVRLEFAATSGDALPDRWRTDVSPEVAKALNAFAHRTYAPATEASRLAGAGAGLSDND